MQNNSGVSTNGEIFCLVIDDEPHALKILVNFIESLPYLKLVAACKNAIEALQQIQQHHIDLLFVDIQMPQILGTDFIRSLQSPPKVIFTTAYRKYAVDGFDLNAVDYLLKPISFDRFLKAVNKVMEIHINTWHTNQRINEQPTSAYPDFILIRADRKDIKVSLKEILYIESLKDYLKLVLEKNTLLTKMPIQNIEKILPPEMFLRVHRSFIVSILKISDFSSGVLSISGLHIPVSRTYRITVLKAIEQLHSN